MSTFDPGGGGPAARFVGAPVVRVEDPRLLTGRGEFVDDVVVPGAVHAHFVRSPYARARIVGIDVRDATTLDGVVAVLTADDLNPMVHAMHSAYQAADDPEMRPLAQGEARFVGDPVAMVLASSRALAEDAAELVVVDYEPLEPVLDYESAADTTNHVWPRRRTNVAFRMDADPAATAAVDAALAASHLTLDETFRQHRQAIVPMEPRGLITRWDPSGGELRIWISHQLPHEVRRFASRLIGVSTNRVRVTQRDVGGGFGQKAPVAREEAATMLATVRLGRPVRWIEDRSENLMSGGHAREEQIRIRIGFDTEARITAAAIEHTESSGAYGVGGYNGKWVGMMFPGPYHVPNYACSAKSVFTNTCVRVPYRAPWMMETVGRECILDLAAQAFGLDPLELRLRNVIRPHELPMTSPGGVEYDRISPFETLEQVVAMAGYEDLRAAQREARAAGRLVGIGLAVTIEPSAKAGPLGVEVATVRIEPDGKVNLLMGTGSHGQSLETTMVQIVADQLGVEMDDVRLQQGDTQAAPFGGGTGGSRSAVIGGAAARLGSQRVAAKAIDIAAHLMEAAPEDLELVGGRVSVRGTPTRSMPLAELAGIAYLQPDRLPAGMEPGLEATSRFSAPPVTLSNASHLCLCEVDPDTWKVRILRYLVSEDCGVIINPLVVEGQIDGGVVQGIGGVLYEQFIYDDAGNPLTTTFLDYTIPTAAEVPRIEHGHVVTPSATPGGHKGMGEGGVLGSVPAVINAVADALSPYGVRLTSQPLGPLQLHRAVAAAGAAARR